jgi:hypothetical protein
MNTMNLNSPKARVKELAMQSEAQKLDWEGDGEDRGEYESEALKAQDEHRKWQRCIGSELRIFR